MTALRETIIEQASELEKLTQQLEETQQQQSSSRSACLVAQKQLTEREVQLAAQVGAHALVLCIKVRLLPADMTHEAQTVSAYSQVTGVLGYSPTICILYVVQVRQLDNSSEAIAEVEENSKKSSQMQQLTKEATLAALNQQIADMQVTAPQAAAAQVVRSWLLLLPDECCAGTVCCMLV